MLYSFSRMNVVFTSGPFAGPVAKEVTSVMDEDSTLYFTYEGTIVSRSDFEPDWQPSSLFDSIRSQCREDELANL